MKSETAWQAGRFGSSRGPNRLLFGAMYEDAEIERVTFQGKDRVFCIASAGATALRLANEHEVIACDINPAQLAYAERRAAGGPFEQGDAERAMNFARTFMPLVGWRASTLRAFLALSDVTGQIDYGECDSTRDDFVRVCRAHVARHLARRVRTSVSFVLALEVRSGSSKADREVLRQAS